MRLSPERRGSIYNRDCRQLSRNNRPFLWLDNLKLNPWETLEMRTWFQSSQNTGDVDAAGKDADEEEEELILSCWSAGKKSRDDITATRINNRKDYQSKGKI
eukprot:Sdes_comp23354_c0_seq1m21619